MDLEWDVEKEQANRSKHGLDFSLAQHVASDPLAVVVYDRFEGGEHRYHAIAVVGTVCLVMVHTYPDPDDEGLIRVIGLRKADPNERRRYEESSDG